IVGKLLGSRYVGRRDPAWVKVKSLGRQEFVLGGFTDPQRSRVGLGALLVGYYEGGRLVYPGKVGTGCTREALLGLRRRLDRLQRVSSPFAAGDVPAGPGVHWARLELVAEVAFAEWARHGYAAFSGTIPEGQSGAGGRSTTSTRPAASPGASAPGS